MRRRSARLTAAIIAGLLDDREPGPSEIVHDLQAIWRHEKTGLLQSDRAVVEASMLRVSDNEPLVRDIKKGTHR